MRSFKLAFFFLCFNAIQTSVRAVSFELPDVVVPEPKVPPPNPKIPDPDIPPPKEPPPIGGTGSSGSQPFAFNDPGNLGKYQQNPPFAGEFFHEEDRLLVQ